MSQERNERIKKAFNGSSILLIDEVSVMTPVLLSLVDIVLTQVFGGKSGRPFGGKHVILVGDMHQFPPVSWRGEKVSLFENAVQRELGKPLQNSDFTKGADLFLRFKLCVLDEQRRANKPYNEWLSRLRNLEESNRFPISRSWLQKIKTLSRKDTQNPDSPWHFAPVAVPSNVERHGVNTLQVQRFAKLNNLPIVGACTPD